MNKLTTRETWLARAEQIVVADDATLEEANAMLATAKEVQKTWMAETEAAVSAAYNAHREAVAHRDKIAKPVKAAIDRLRQQCGAYVAEMRRRAEEEAAKKRAEAEAEARREAERLRKEADKLKTPELAEARRELADMIVAPTVEVETTAAVSSVKTRVTYSFLIEDESKLPREYLVPDTAKIGRVVRAHQGAVTIPGVKIVKRTSAL